MSQTPPVRWCAVPGAELAWRDWDGEVVVFNQRTGSTHLLGEFGGEIFRRLVATKQGATVEALAVARTDDPSGTEDASWSEAVAEVLSEFARIGLAQPDES
jgi:PqqD family protein of HPr-rel-A system